MHHLQQICKLAEPNSFTSYVFSLSFQQIRYYPTTSVCYAKLLLFELLKQSEAKLRVESSEQKWIRKQTGTELAVKVLDEARRKVSLESASR